MTKDLFGKAMMKAINLRQPRPGLVFHSDRGSRIPAIFIASYWQIMA
jgi:transposase InsO family protein